MKIRDSGERGFTLLELLIATAISVAVLVMIIRVVIVVLQQADHSVGLVSRGSEMDNVRRYLELDIQSAFLQEAWRGGMHLIVPGQGWETEGWDTVPNDSKPTDQVISTTASLSESILDERWGKEGLQASWIVNDPSKGLNDPGGLKMVGYQIKRLRLSNDSYPRYVLMRSETSAYETLKQGYEIQSSAYEHGSFSPDAYWSASVVRHPNRNHIIADNIIDFGIRLYERNIDSTRWELVFPNGIGTLDMARRPMMWMVMLRVLSDEGAEMIENIEQGRSNDDWWETALRFSEVLSFQLETM